MKLHPLTQVSPFFLLFFCRTPPHNKIFRLEKDVAQVCRYPLSYSRSRIKCGMTASSEGRPSKWGYQPVYWPFMTIFYNDAPHLLSICSLSTKCTFTVLSPSFFLHSKQLRISVKLWNFTVKYSILTNWQFDKRMHEGQIEERQKKASVKSTELEMYITENSLLPNYQWNIIKSCTSLFLVQPQNSP